MVFNVGFKSQSGVERTFGLQWHVHVHVHVRRPVGTTNDKFKRLTSWQREAMAASLVAEASLENHRVPRFAAATTLAHHLHLTCKTNTTFGDGT